MDSDEPISAAPPPIPIADSEFSITPKESYIVQHWRGKHPLPIAYWVNCFCVSFLAIIFVNVFSKFVEEANLIATSALMIAVYALHGAVCIWQIVGTWRSASNHVKLGGNVFWAGMAKVMLVVSTATHVKTFSTSIIPQTIEFASIVAGDYRIPAYKIRVLPGGSEIEFQGGLRAGAARDFKQILQAVPQAHVLHINSVGGRCYEAMEIANLIRQHELVTHVQEHCLSAASLMFLAGKERVVNSGAKIGFHSASFPGVDAEQANERLLDLFRESGVSKDFANHALSTPPDQMWFPSAEEMQIAGVITSRSFGDRFAVSGALLDARSEDIDKAWRSLPAFDAFRRLEPVAYDTMVKDYISAIHQGMTEADATAKIRRVFESLTMNYLPRTTDDAIIGMRDCWIKLLGALKDEHPDECLAIIAPQIAGNHNYSSLLPERIKLENLAALERVLVGASAAEREVNQEQASADLEEIRERMRPTFGRDLSLMGDESKWRDNAKRLCDMLYALYQETQSFPRSRQANLLRYMLAEPSNE